MCREHTHNSELALPCQQKCNTKEKGKCSGRFKDGFHEEDCPESPKHYSVGMDGIIIDKGQAVYLLCQLDIDFDCVKSECPAWHPEQFCSDDANTKEIITKLKRFIAEKKAEAALKEE